MNKLALVVALIASSSLLSAQNQWTEQDRKYLVDNETRTRDELTKETENLSENQWNFKESPDRWSINQVVEHLCIWELITDHETSRSLEAGPKPERTSPPDSLSLNFIMENKPHHSLEFTKPFTYSIPSGLNPGKNNLMWFTKMRNESIGLIASTKENFRIYFCVYGSLHEHYILSFGHTVRHLRQIRKIKEHPNYPK